MKPIFASAVSDFGPLRAYRWLYGAAVYRYEVPEAKADFEVWTMEEIQPMEPQP